ncbi:MAG TPA: hypothetical protein VIJ94_00275 [Caulobacteraceae bacterium]
MVDGYISVGHDKIRKAQLPPKIVTKGGVALVRPPVLELTQPPENQMPGDPPERYCPVSNST